MKEDVFLKSVRSHILKVHGKYKDAAEAWGVTKSYLSLILKGDRPPSKAMLDDLGYDRIVETKVKYEKRPKE